jgi:hypothetical protein
MDTGPKKGDKPGNGHKKEEGKGDEEKGCFPGVFSKG